MERERFTLEKAKKAKRLITRDGRDVESWRVADNPKLSFFCIEVVVRAKRGDEREAYRINQNGRRWLNVISDDDVFIPKGKKNAQKREKWPYDCMPDVMKAIQYIKEGRYAMIATANKCPRQMITKDFGGSYEVGNVE